MSPYIVTTRHDGIGGKEPWTFRESVIARRAVATEEEARNAVERDESGRARGQDVYDEMESWEGEPITIALSDGAVIEVEGVSLVEMYRRAGFEWDAHGPDAMVPLSQVIAAYNAAQGGQSRA